MSANVAQASVVSAETCFPADPVVRFKPFAQVSADSGSPPSSAPESDSTRATFLPDSVVVSAEASKHRMSCQLLPRDGARLLGGLMRGDDPRAVDDVRGELAYRRTKWPKMWKDVGVGYGSGFQITYVRDVLKVTRDDQALVFAAEASQVWVKHSAEKVSRKDNDGNWGLLWGPSSNVSVLRTGFDLGYRMPIDETLTLQADVLYGINLVAMRVEFEDGICCLPNSTAPYVGGRVSVTGPKAGCYVQVDDDVKGPVKGKDNVRGTIGVVYSVQELRHQVKKWRND